MNESDNYLTVDPDLRNRSVQSLNFLCNRLRWTAIRARVANECYRNFMYSRFLQ